MELCWLITNKCNSDCSFCHFFERDKYIDLPIEKNITILENIDKAGIKAITWSGGEALQYIGIETLLNISKKMNIHNSLITNGWFPDWLKRDLFINIDQLVVSIDSSDDTINMILGRNSQQTKNVQSIIELARSVNPNISIRINSVMCKSTLYGIEELASFLADLKIDFWRISKFAPLRGRAQTNQNIFDISDLEYKNAIQSAKGVFPEIIQIRQDNDFELKYLLIAPDGSIIQTKNNMDIIMGTALEVDALIKAWGNDETSNFTGKTKAIT